MMKNKVKELRARFGYSQEKLGETVGVTRQTVAAIEKGDYVPSLLLALKNLQSLLHENGGCLLVRGGKLR
ncbi:DNA-binding XRE family transcriptional regulator [Bacillus subtilis]